MTTAQEFLSAGKQRRYRNFDAPHGLEHLQCVIRSLTQREREEYEADMVGQDGVKLDRAKLAKRELIRLTFCEGRADEHGELVEGHGNLIFSHRDLRDLADADSALVQCMYEQSRSHVGMRASDVDSLVGNSDAGPVSDSPTASA